MRGTFLSKGQSLLVRRELEREKAVKEAMIHSVMPPKVARWLLQEEEGEEGGEATREVRKGGGEEGGSQPRK